MKALPSGRTLYDVAINIDDHGRRVVEGSPANFAQHIFLFGDSYTFGTGASQGFTYADWLQWKRPSDKIYNFGVGGYAPNFLLYELEERPRRFVDIQKKGGFSSYLFIDDHVERVLCRLSCYHSRRKWLHRLGTRYVLDGHGKISRPSSFADRHIPVFLLRALASSALVDFFKIDFPYVSDADLKLFVELMKQIKTITQERYVDGPFYFIVYPGYNIYAERLLPLLRDAHFEVIDLRFAPFNKTLQGKDRIPVDTHPTPAAYLLLSLYLDKYFPKAE